jgi:hypothetical protein
MLLLKLCIEQQWREILRVQLTIKAFSCSVPSVTSGSSRSCGRDSTRPGLSQLHSCVGSYLQQSAEQQEAQQDFGADWEELGRRINVQRHAFAGLLVCEGEDGWAAAAAPAAAGHCCLLLVRAL